MEINKDIIQNEIIRPTVTRRIGIAITDFFMFIFLFLTFNTYIISPAFAKTSNYLNTVEQYTERMIESNLYIKSNNTVIELINSKDKDTNERDFYKYVDSKLTKFYLEFSNEGINIENYNKNKVESNYFEIINNEYIIKNDVSNESLKTFFNEEYTKALTLFNNYDDVYLDLARKITNYSIFTIILSLTLSSLILYLIIPLCMRNGETIGKRLFFVGLASAKDGFKVKRSQIVIRYLVFYTLEILVSIIAVGLPLIVSFSMLVFNKNGYTIHDYLAATVLVDRKKSVIYKDYEEFINHERIALN